MENTTREKRLIVLGLLTFLIGLLGLSCQADNVNLSTKNTTDKNHQVHVGLILEMGSMEGMILQSCISMALLDFYALHNNYKTRLVLHTRDSKGETLLAFSAALDLLDNVKVETIIGGQTTMEAMFLAELGNKAEVLVLSLSQPSSSPRSNKYPFFIQIRQDDTSQFKAVASIVEVFKWRNVILIYEDSDFGRNSITYVLNSFQEENIYIVFKSAVASSWTDEEFVEELHKLTTLQTTTFIVHLSRVLASKLVVYAKKLGMMSEGYAWFLSATTMNDLLQYSSERDYSVVVQSTQGVIGVKSYVPASSELQYLTSRLRRKVFNENPFMEITDQLSVYAIWAYDSTWALAEAVERSFTHGSQLAKEIKQSRFMGLSGEFEITNGKIKSIDTFGIVNIIGKGERRVGFWKYAEKISTGRESHKGIIRRHLLSPDSDQSLETIIWPGGTTVIPKGRSDIETMSSVIKLRIGVPVSEFTELVRVSYNDESNKTSITGFCIKVFEAAINLLPYGVEYQLIPFGFNMRRIPGTYEDLIDQVFLKKYDAAVGDITITSNRSKYVDFTQPFTELGTGMVLPTERKSNNMWIFLKPLSADLWLITTSFFLLTGFVVWVIEHPTNQAFQGSPAQQIGTIFWFSFSTLVYAHREKLLNNLSKFVIIVWVFVVLILTSSYTATLASMMTVQRMQLEAKGNIGFYSKFVLNYHLNVTNNMSLKVLRSPKEYYDALSKGSEHGGVSAVVDEIPYIKDFLTKYDPNHYTMVKSESTTSGFGFAFQKGSPLVQDMSTAITKLRESGELAKLENAWFQTKSSRDSTDEPNALNFMTFRGLFLISGISSTGALFFFLISSLREKWRVMRNYIRVRLSGSDTALQWACLG